MMKGKDIFFSYVDSGREGHNIGLDVGSEKMMLYMDGYLPGTSYLIGGASGTGKSTYALWAFIYKPLIAFLSGEGKERDPYWILFNLEMTQPQIYAKLVSMYIFDNFHIQLRFKEIFSRGKDTILTDEHYEIIKKCNDFLDELDKRLICYDGFLDEHKYMNVMFSVLKRFGHYNDDNKFVPNNPQQIVGVLIDHCSLVRAAQGRSKKDEMDAISRDSVQFRNKTGIVSPIHVSQLNRSGSSDVRIQQGLCDVMDSDFKDSGSLYEDSQVVIALNSPFRNKQAKYRGYDIKKMEQAFIALQVLKTRFGSSQIVIPTGFYGDCSHYADLPKPEEIDTYERFVTPEWTLQEVEQQIVTDNKFKNVFKCF